MDGLELEVLSVWFTSTVNHFLNNGKEDVG